MTSIQTPTAPQITDQARSQKEGEESTLLLFVVGVIVMMFAIMICKRVGRSLAKWISKTYVKKDPMSKQPVTLSKFTDQFWQLIVHAVRDVRVHVMHNAGVM